MRTVLACILTLPFLYGCPSLVKDSTSFGAVESGYDSLFLVGNGACQGLGYQSFLVCRGPEYADIGSDDYVYIALPEWETDVEVSGCGGSKSYSDRKNGVIVWIDELYGDRWEFGKRCFLSVFTDTKVDDSTRVLMQATIYVYGHDARFSPVPDSGDIGQTCIVRYTTQGRTTSSCETHHQ